MPDIIPVVAEQQEQHLPAKTDTGLQPLELENISALHTAEAAPIDLMSEYWSPENKGEQRRVLFDRIQVMSTMDQATGELIELECAFFFWQENPDAPIKQIRNGSKRLVGAIQSFGIPRLTPLLIRYQGKVRNKSNQNLSDNWSITPLRIDVQNK